MARATRNIALSGQGSVGQGGIIGGNANTSGDTSTCEFQAWKVCTYFFAGTWKRFWQYGTDPTPVGGVEGNPVSACPQVAGNYVTFYGNITASVKKEYASYCSGLYQPLGLELGLDESFNASGGFGVSGWCTTSQVGQTRVTWNELLDEESWCNKAVTATLSVQDGAYNPSFDTSSNFTSEMAKAFYAAKDVCPTFDPNIVAG
jgi:hypothetical protein